MTRNEYNVAVADLAAVARLHQQTTPAHLSRGCALCQSLNDRREQLAARWGWVATEVRSG